DGGIGRLVKVFRRRPAQAFPPEIGLLIVVFQRALFHFIQSLLQVVPEFLFHLLGHITRVRLTVLQQVAGVHFAGVGVLIDQRIEAGLGELGIVTFIMPVTPVAHHVYENIGIKFLAIAGGDLGTFYYCFGIIAVYVQHGR